MAQVITKDGLVEESTLTWNVWREDHGDSWTIVHEMKDREGTIVRRDAWVIFKAGGLKTEVTKADFA